MGIYISGLAVIAKHKKDAETAHEESERLHACIVVLKEASARDKAAWEQAATAAWGLLHGRQGDARGAQASQRSREWERRSRWV